VKQVYAERIAFFGWGDEALFLLAFNEILRLFPPKASVEH
jgi:hypothetical protein